jgi:regulator of sigma E protease
MTTLLAFLVTLAILIIIHEFGHYAVARMCGVKVLRFSVGFGQVVVRRQDRHGTEWALSAMPLGGYVKMLDEREGDVPAAELPLAFNRKNVWQRMAIVAAGPAANFLLAIVLYWALFVAGVPALKPLLGMPEAGTPAALAGIQAGETVLAINGAPVEEWQDVHWLALRHGVGGASLRLETRDANDHLYFRQLDLAGVDSEQLQSDTLATLGLKRYLPPLAPVLGQVVPDGRAAAAGLRAGDRILAVDGAPVRQWEQVVERVKASPDRPLELDVQRGQERIGVKVTPKRETEAGRDVGRIGAAPRVDPAQFEALRTEVRHAPLKALGKSLEKIWDLSVFSLEMLGRMVIGQASLQNLSGPITIADYAGQAAQTGAVAFVGFLALISVSLGVLNLLPIPLLDGGHLLYYFAEVLTGKPVPERIQEIGQRIGLAILGFLMIFALFNDFHRLLAG